jgi:nitroimidazol reductase NimA-like FMN-containing flavoprotein (pyridoxamine 5'-phosphate oxidase superfamily)
MIEPKATRPHMPGYGIVAADAGSGLLTWSWAVQKLTSARNYWLATVRPDARPHAMPVWAVWQQDTLFFSGSTPSRKMRNLRDNPHCVLTTEDAMEPVVVEGTAEFVTDLDTIGAFLAGMNAKYDTDYNGTPPYASRCVRSSRCVPTTSSARPPVGHSKSRERGTPRVSLQVTSTDGRAWATADGNATLVGPGSDPDGPEVQALVDYCWGGSSHGCVHKGLDVAGEVAQPRVLVDRLEREPNAELGAYPGDEIDRQERVPAELEEVVLRADQGRADEL